MLSKDSSKITALVGCIASNTTISEVINTIQNWYVSSEIDKLISNISSDTLYRQELFAGAKKIKLNPKMQRPCNAQNK